MCSTITAMFDSRADAEAAKVRLTSANVDVDHVHVHDWSTAGYCDSGYSTHRDRGMWESIKNAFLPDEDRHAYEEGVRRGGAVLTADVNDDGVAEVVRVLEDAGSIDIDERTGQWRSAGWNYPAAAAAFGASGATVAPHAEALTATEEAMFSDEEERVVGKRDISRGGARVRTYVTEPPVYEQFRGQNEPVEVERRTVGLPLSAADDEACCEPTIENGKVDCGDHVARRADGTSSTAYKRI